MATHRELAAAGIPPTAAGMLGGGGITVAVAAGSDKASATPLIAPMTALSSGAAGGVSLPFASAQPIWCIYNGSGNAQTVYGSGNEAINTQGSFTLASGKAGFFVPAGNAWIAVLSA